MQRRLASVQGVEVRDVREVWLGEIQKSKGVSGCLGGWMLDAEEFEHTKNQRRAWSVQNNMCSLLLSYKELGLTFPRLCVTCFKFAIYLRSIQVNHTAFACLLISDIWHYFAECCNPTKFASAPSSKHHIILLPPVSNKNTTPHSQEQLRLAKFACHVA